MSTSRECALFCDLLSEPIKITKDDRLTIVRLKTPKVVFDSDRLCETILQPEEIRRSVNKRDLMNYLADKGIEFTISLKKNEVKPRPVASRPRKAPKGKSFATMTKEVEGFAPNILELIETVFSSEEVAYSRFKGEFTHACNKINNLKMEYEYSYENTGTTLDGKKAFEDMKGYLEAFTKLYDKLSQIKIRQTRGHTNISELDRLSDLADKFYTGD